MNPELVRTLWLEATPQRLWLIPATLLGSALIIARTLPAALPALALTAFVALTAVWGARQAANAVLDEVREHTWDIQRMAALSAWRMTWGKLVGACAMPWYAGVICLGLYAAYRPPELGAETAWRMAFAALLALAAQGLALTAAITAVNAERHARGRVNLLLVLFLLSLLLPALGTLSLPDVADVAGIRGSVSWYGRVWPAPLLAVVALAALAAWMVFAAWRSMCIELQSRTLPWAWLAFIVCVASFVCGLQPEPPLPAAGRRWFSTAAVIACALGYVAAFALARDPLQYRRVLQALAERRYRRALEDMPLAVTAAAFAVALALPAALLGSDPGISNERIDNAGAVTLGLALLLVRDLGLLLFTSFRERSRRGAITALIYIAVLNRILPGLLAVAGLAPLAGFVAPPLFTAPAGALAVCAVHAVAGTALAVAAWRRAMRPLTPPGDRRS